MRLCRAEGAALARRFLADENGATAIEYAMIAAGVGATVSAAVVMTGETVETTFYDRLLGLFPQSGEG